MITTQWHVEIILSRFNLRLRFLLSCLLLLCSTFVYGDEARTLTVSAGSDRPPYIMNHSQSGFEVELISAVLSQLGYQPTILANPHSRSIELFNRGEVDVVLTLNANSGVAAEHLSDVYIIYQNVALSLRKKALKLEHITQLANLNVIAFQGATTVFGQDYKAVASSNARYLEVPDQQQQVSLFLQEKTDLIILDLNVFNYLSMEMTGQSQIRQVNIHPLFMLNRFSAGFKDIAVKNAFNQALGQFVQSGAYEKLIEQYDYQIVDTLNHPVFSGKTLN